MPFQLIAHRGDSAHAPENTFAAFDLAIAKGFAQFETDCQLSSDGACVILHGEELGVGKDDGGAGPVAACTLVQLQTLDVGSWFGEQQQFAGQRIPTLEALLERYAGRAHIHLVRRKTREGHRASAGGDDGWGRAHPCSGVGVVAYALALEWWLAHPAWQCSQCSTARSHMCLPFNRS